MLKRHPIFSKNLFFSLLCYLCWTTSLEGKDFGIRGELFSIEEENLILVLQKRMIHFNSPEHVQTLLKKIQDKAGHPMLSTVITEATEHHIFYYDPSYTLKEPITDTHGTLIIPRGTKVNPLKTIHLQDGLLFLDGDNPDHIQWAREQKTPFKWILVRGNPFELEKQENRPVYFDQNGFSISKLRLQHVPARVTQDGHLLKIEEIPIKKSPI